MLVPDTAHKQLSRIENAIIKLETFPERYKLYDMQPWNERNLHIMPVDNYCVFYIPNKQDLTVNIIRVIYNGRDMNKQLHTLEI